jgi:hypothetical protein
VQPAATNAFDARWSDQTGYGGAGSSCPGTFSNAAAASIIFADALQLLAAEDAYHPSMGSTTLRLPDSAS